MARNANAARRKKTLKSGNISRCDIIVPALPQLLHGRFAGVGSS